MRVYCTLYRLHVSVLYTVYTTCECNVHCIDYFYKAKNYAIFSLYLQCLSLHLWLSFVQPQVSHFKEFIPKAFPSGDDLILDAEVLLIDNNTGNPLPFGTLGKHKVTAQFSR